MADRTDRVALVHPLLPDVTIHVHPRGVPARLANGWWVYPQSPAKPVEPNPSLEGTNTTPSKEES